MCVRNGVRVGASPGGSTTRLLAMTTAHDPIGQLRTDWRWRARRPDARAAFEGLRERHVELEPGDAVDLYDLVASLDRDSSRSAASKSQVLRILLLESADPLIRRALMQALIPGIIAVCRRYRFGAGIASVVETTSMALSFVEDVTREWAGQSRPYAGPDILSAVRCRLRRWLLKEKAAIQDLAGPTEIEIPEGPERASRLEGRLVSLARTSHDRLARLTFECAIGGERLSELARRDHSSVPSLRRELQVFALAHVIE